MGKHAFEGPRRDVFLVDPNELIVVGLDTEDGPSHPLYDERVKLPLDESFVKLMILQGFKGTVRCRKNGPKYEVVFGRQRVRTCREANERLIAVGKEPLRVEVRVESGTDAEVMGLSLSENTYRQNDDAIIMANKVKRYLDLGRDEDEAAVVFHCSKQHIKNLMRLHDLDASVRRAVERGDLSASAAAPLADLSRDEQKAALEKMLKDGPVTAKVTKNVAKRNKNAQNGSSDDASIAPGKRLVTKILKLNKAKGGILADDVVAGILWVLGEKPSRSIKGLTELEREASSKTEKE